MTTKNMDYKITVYIDEDMYKALEDAKKIYTKEKDLPVEPKMSEYLRNIVIRKHLDRIKKKGN